MSQIKSPYPKGKLPLADLQKPLPITKPTFIINSPDLQQYLAQYCNSTMTDGQNNAFDLSQFSIYTLDNPVYRDVRQKYMLINYNLYEIRTITPTSVKEVPHCRNAKFLGNYIESNATYYLSTPIDLLFIFLPSFLTKFKFHGTNIINDSTFFTMAEILLPNENSTKLGPDEKNINSEYNSQTVYQNALGTTTDNNTHLKNLYYDLFQTSSLEKRELICAQFEKWCDLQKIDAHNSSQNSQNQFECYFRINYQKLEALLKLKIARLCSQITSTPSLQSLSITANPAIKDNNGPQSNITAEVSLSDSNLHALSLSKKHFKGFTRSWDGPSSMIYANALSYIGEYLPRDYFEYFLGLFCDHLGEKFSAEKVKEILDPKKKPSSVASSGHHTGGVLPIGDHDGDNDVTRKKRAAVAAPQSKAKKAKVNPAPPKGQPGILSFFGKK
jgi:hypothetical protein